MLDFKEKYINPFTDYGFKRLFGEVRIIIKMMKNEKSYENNRNINFDIDFISRNSF